MPLVLSQVASLAWLTVDAEANLNVWHRSLLERELSVFLHFLVCFDDGRIEPLLVPQDLNTLLLLSWIVEKVLLPSVIVARSGAALREVDRPQVNHQVPVRRQLGKGYRQHVLFVISQAMTLVLILTHYAAS